MRTYLTFRKDEALLLALGRLTRTFNFYEHNLNVIILRDRYIIPSADVSGLIVLEERLFKVIRGHFRYPAVESLSRERLTMKGILAQVEIF